VATSKSTRASAGSNQNVAFAMFSQMMDQRFEHLEAFMHRIEEAIKTNKSENAAEKNRIEETFKTYKSENTADKNHILEELAKALVRVADVENRCTKLESSQALLRWLAGSIGTVVVGLVVTLMFQRLNTPPTYYVAPPPLAQYQMHEGSYTWMP
jgi:hypothetical protein